MMTMCLCNADVLATAIMQRAALDYHLMLKHGDCAAYNRTELELFFRSPLAGAILGCIDPEWMIGEIRRGRIKQCKPYAKRRKANGKL